MRDPSDWTGDPAHEHEYLLVYITSYTAASIPSKTCTSQKKLLNKDIKTMEKTAHKKDF